MNKYREKVQQKLQEIDEETDINRDWQNLKQANTRSCKGIQITQRWKEC